MRLFDSHAHLDDTRFDADRNALITALSTHGVTAVLNPGSNMQDSANAVALSEKHPHIYAAVGVHPHDAKDFRASDVEQLRTWLEKPKVRALGEIGLDYHYDFSPRDIQKDVFAKQLDLAIELKKPIIIHEREAYGDLIAILNARKTHLPKGVFHCFSGSIETAKEVLRLGFYISLAGPVTYPNARKTAEVAAYVPLERLLIETDSPYLAPIPYRGQRNEPRYVLEVAKRIAVLRNLSVEIVAEASYQNTCALFDIAP